MVQQNYPKAYEAYHQAVYALSFLTLCLLVWLMHC